MHIGRSSALRIVLTGAIFSGALLLPSLSKAHYLWATLVPGAKKVNVGLQELPTDEPIPMGDQASAIRSLTATKAEVKLAEDGGWLKGSTDSDCVGFSMDYGVLDRTKQGRGIYRLFYYAKSALSLEASEAKVSLPLDMSVSRDDAGRLVGLVLENDKPLAKANVTIHLTADSVFTGVTGDDGKVNLPDLKGAIAVLVGTSRKESGQSQGLSYEVVRSYVTLHIPAPASDTELLTRVLRKSFGDSHDVVGETAFVETLMSGRLTKSQLESHLQQRALIHEEVDRVLTASKVTGLPYGPDQIQLITLLKDDLTKMGSAWPTAAIATPLTRAFIDELRQSAVHGPYFALGVLHVYYGGITHGGRDIGAKIVETVKVDTTYYLKTDGYAAYATKVNEILDEKARKEMISGGKVAYKYIIATSDEPIFKARP